ncbi:MAG: hypothetical protein KDD52_07625 [Bdellovibrionales bacterium]|nr:hypothetical protein [Bdellovibrionales bacterium]
MKTVCLWPGQIIKQALYFSICMMAFVSPTHSVSMPEVSFSHGLHAISDSGYYRLQWELDEAKEGVQNLQYELQRKDLSKGDVFKTLYLGVEQASFVSGLLDGKYLFRVRSVQNQNKMGPWSSVFTLTVKNPSLVLAIGLFALGAMVFVATVVLVATGVRRSS